VAFKTNALYYGDNLDILRRYVPDASVDLVYLDPPFNSNATLEPATLGADVRIVSLGPARSAKRRWGRALMARRAVG
jgi:hypothetical protein